MHYMAVAIVPRAWPNEGTFTIIYLSCKLKRWKPKSKLHSLRMIERRRCNSYSGRLWVMRVLSESDFTGKFDATFLTQWDSWQYARLNACRIVKYMQSASCIQQMEIVHLIHIAKARGDGRSKGAYCICICVPCSCTFLLCDVILHLYSLFHSIFETPI